MKHTIITLAAATLAGCFPTSPGQIGPDDLQTRAVKMAPQPAHVASAFYDGMRRCEEYRIAQCGPARPDGSVSCDIYTAPAPLSLGNTQWVIGRAEFLPAANGTVAEFSIVSNYAALRPDRAALMDRQVTTWVGYANGACGKKP